MHEPLRVAVIGYGLAGSVFHAPLVASTPGMSVSTIVTRDPRRQKQAKGAYPDATILDSADDIWHHPDLYDLVVVATPNRSHVQLGLQCVQAGLAVVIDKPLASSVAEGLELIEEAERRQVPLTVFQNRRLDGDFLTLQHILNREILGPIARFESRFERYRPTRKAGAWRESPEPEEAGGLLFDLGSHLIDQAIVLFGAPTAVYAEIERRRPGVQVDDDTFISLRFANGPHAHLWMNVVVRTQGPRFHVSGLRGSYQVFGLDPQETALKDGQRPGAADWGAVPRPDWGSLSTDIEGLHVNGPVETLPGRYEEFYAGVRDALTMDAALPVQPRESLAVLQVIEAAFRSAGEKVIVDLTQLP